MHFSLRARQEHHGMMVEDISIEKDDDGVEFTTFSKALQRQDKVVCEWSLG